MATTKGSSDFEQSSQEGESRPPSGVGSYEDDFERGLEDERAPATNGHDFQDEFEGNWNGAPVVLDHSSHRDCDEDLENELTYGLSRPKDNGHFYHFERDDEDPGGRRGSRFLEFFRKRGKDPQADSFFDAAEEVGYDSTPDSGVHENQPNVGSAQWAKQEEELKNELIKTEEEIATLRSVLAAKMKHSQDLKQRLGITVWQEFRGDMEQGLKNVKESDVFQKTETVIKTAGTKTTAVLQTLGATVSKKLGEVKNSETFKSFEEQVGSAYTNVKTKVSGSRSNSMQSFDEALANTEGKTSSTATPATTPMIPEDRPLL